MMQSLVPVGLFLLVLVSLPWLAKILKKRVKMGGQVQGAESKVISAVAVGPHQRVVTVEVGLTGARTLLVLGVTAQSITCLHTAPANDGFSQTLPPPVDHP